MGLIDTPLILHYEEIRQFEIDVFYALPGSPADWVFLAEWRCDGRRLRSISVWANDLFSVGFPAYGDLQGTEFVAGILDDLRHEYRALKLELKRRPSDSWSMCLKVIANLGVAPQDLTYDGRRDGLGGVELTFSL